MQHDKIKNRKRCTHKSLPDLRNLAKDEISEDQLSTADEHDVSILADREAELLDGTPAKSTQFPDPPQAQNTAVPPHLCGELLWSPR